MILCLGRSKSNYFKDVQRHLINNPCAKEGSDYIKYQPIDSSKRGAKIKNYIIPIHVAKSICFNERSQKARQIIDHLETVYENVA